MKQKSTLIIVLSLVLNTAFGQTKLISHKSHSGNTANFKTSLANHLFDIDASNFGAAPQRFVTNARLDTVIYISKKKSRLITSSCYHDIREDTGSVWKPGSEIVYNHPLFTKRHSLDSIKMILKNQYNFKNAIDSVVFIGYDNKKSFKNKDPKKNSFPLVNIFNPPNNTPFSLSTPSLIGVLLLISLCISFIYFKFNHSKYIIKH